MNIVDLLEQSKAKLKVSSDYALAKQLEMNSGDITGFRKGARRPTPYALVKIALLLDLDPLALIAEAEAQSEKNPARKGFWENFARRVGTAAGIVAVFCMANFGSVCAEHGSAFSRCRKFA
jgi:hypothetical protein